MAMTAAGLSTRLRGKAVALSWMSDGPELTELCDFIAEAVVEEIQANAVASTTVNPLGLIAPSGGGPVTGTASTTGTVS